MRRLAFVLALIGWAALAASTFAQNKEADQEIDPSKTKTSHSESGDTQTTETKYFDKNGAPVKTEKATVNPEGTVKESEVYRKNNIVVKTTEKTDNFGKEVQTTTETFKDGTLVAGMMTGPKLWKVFNPDTGTYEDWKPVKPFSQVPQPWQIPEPQTGKTTSMAPDAKPSLNQLTSRGTVKIDTVGTGETIGHIADLKIENLTDQPINCSVGPMVLESKSRKNQDYVCPKTQTAKIDPHGTATVPVDGVCVNRHKPPVDKGVTGDLLVNTGDPTVPPDPDSHIPANQARDLLRICTSKYDAADKLQEDGALKDLPYKDKQKQKDIVVQWSTWSDPRICEITGAPPATKEDLKKVVYKQVEEKGPMTPAMKKKVDQGIDTIFEKVELTTAKAKDLEEPEEYAQTEMPPGSFEISDQTGESSESPPPKTQEKPKKEKKEKKDKGPPGKWPNPVKDWWIKLVDAMLADHKEQSAQDDYKKLLDDFFKKSKHHEELKKAIEQKQAAINYGNTSENLDKLVKERDELKKELAKLEGELEKDFQKTDEGKKALVAKGDAEKAAADAHKAEQEAGKYLDKEAIGEKALEELEKTANEEALKKYKYIGTGSGTVHE